MTEAVTTQGEGYVSAATIKRLPNGDINGLTGRYTTCNLEHPHFYIQARKMKVIPGEKVVTGPFNLVIGDVPTPLGFLFGFFPMPNKSRGSGVLIPTFGQAADRGYYLTNGGYYFAPNDYIGVRLTGDIYAGNAQTFGGWGATADISVPEALHLPGQLQLALLQPAASTPFWPPTPSPPAPVYIKPPAANSFWITWNHTPVPKPGGGRFSASVNAGTSSFNKRQQPRCPPLPGHAVQLQHQLLQAASQPAHQLRHQAQPEPGHRRHHDLHAARHERGRGPAVPLPVVRHQAGRGRQAGASSYEQFTLSYNLTARNEVSNTVAARAAQQRPAAAGRHHHAAPPFR